MVRSVAIDAGQSGVRARVLNDPLHPKNLAYEPDLREHRGLRTDLSFAEQVVEVISAIADEAGSIDAVAIGSTGFTGQEDLRGLDAVADYGVRTVLLAHDSTISYLGALGTQQGAVVASGTGVVTLAVGAKSVARVDGWGNIMGDAGSGHWFGQAALIAAMRAYDGRGPDTLLLDRLRAEFPYVESAYIQLQADPNRIRRTASFSRSLTEAAGDGDPVASAICRRGAAELAHSVTSGLDKVRVDPALATPVCALGGMFRSTAVVTEFTAELLSRRPQAKYRPPHGDGLDGAAQLFELSPANPLNARVISVYL